MNLSQPLCSCQQSKLSQKDAPMSGTYRAVRPSTCLNPRRPDLHLSAATMRTLTSLVCTIIVHQLVKLVVATRHCYIS